MRAAGAALFAALVGLVLAATAEPLGVPGQLGTVSLKPLPAAGHAEFFVITATGTVSGKAQAPTMLLSGSPPPGNVVAAAVEPKPVQSGNKVTAKIYVALLNPTSKKTVRLPASVRDGSAIDFIVSAAGNEWGSPRVSNDEYLCAEVAKALHNAHLLWSQFWARKSYSHLTAEQLVAEAESYVKNCA
ncbi:MAG TPA: hypothetical protein VFB25_06285 [Gaiellaceae bacterium]|nr:hypothetical protein [Gaiellaceae bacterium]